VRLSGSLRSCARDSPDTFRGATGCRRDGEAARDETAAQARNATSSSAYGVMSSPCAASQPSSYNVCA
jgi:hypothetical protein